MLVLSHLLIGLEVRLVMDVRLLSHHLCDLQCTSCVVLIAERFLRQAALKNYKEDVMNCVRALVKMLLKKG